MLRRQNKEVIINNFKIPNYFLKLITQDVEIDLEDLLTNPFNTQPPSLDELQRLTGFQRNWLMFVYRNFKQICSNGRMCQSQWRQIFRLIFKRATDYDFADRFFLAIAGSRSQKLITFEDLIFCLYDICSSIQHDPDTGEHFTTESPPNMTAPQFVFNLMLPDSQGRVDEIGFVKYTKSIFDLNASINIISGSGDASTFGMFQQFSSNNASQTPTTDRSIISGSTTTKNQERKLEIPWITNLAKKQFRQLDVDGDGYITLQDIQRLFEQKTQFYEYLYLKTEDVKKQSTSEINNNNINTQKC